MNTKLHAIVDAKTRPISFFMTAGQVSDYTGAAALLDGLPKAPRLLGDRGYDADWFRDALEEKGITPCMPGRKSRTKPVKYDKRRYKSRNRIEIMFGNRRSGRQQGMAHEHVHPYVRHMVDLSILDLVRVTLGDDAHSALDNARDLAAHAEGWGYNRFWVAEHHNMPGIASAATAVVLSHIAAGTSSIRVGAGGIMLPNHAPFIIAEQFGTLATLFPGRIDLGLGRAPGTDQLTARALRRGLTDPNDFPRDVLELQAYFQPVQPGQRIQAVPAAGTNVPLWILGSSTYGAQLAAEFGLPYAFASHFAPDMLMPALQIYRARFKPSVQLARPHAMIGVNIIAAETDGDARRLATTQQMSFTNMLRGVRGLSQPPIDDIDAWWSPAEKAQVSAMLARSIVGGPDAIRAGLATLTEETGADELMIVSDIYNHEDRLRSFELIAEAAAKSTKLAA